MTVSEAELLINRIVQNLQEYHFYKRAFLDDKQLGEVKVNYQSKYKNSKRVIIKAIKALSYHTKEKELLWKLIYHHLDQQEQFYGKLGIIIMKDELREIWEKRKNHK